MAKVKGDFIKFLGTAGARFVMIKQLRSSGGIWISSGGTNILVDPGPGSIVRCAMSRPRIDPTQLSGIILTHRHLDHSSDINVMIEAMTEGGFKKKGTVFLPADAIEEDAVLLRHTRQLPERIEILKEKTGYAIADFKFMTSVRHRHPVETYGLRFKLGREEVSLLSDTAYFEGLSDFYRKSDILIICVVFLEPRPGVEHLCLADAEKLILEIRPKKAIMTHFGMTMLAAKPHIQAEKLSRKLGIEVLAAYDGMTIAG